MASFSALCLTGTAVLSGLQWLRAANVHPWPCLTTRRGERLVAVGLWCTFLLLVRPPCALRVAQVSINN